MTDLAPAAVSAGDQPPASAAPPPPAAATALEAAVNGWVASDLVNSPVSRATDAWNHLQQALPHLIAKLKEL